MHTTEGADLGEQLMAGVLGLRRAVRRRLNLTLPGPGLSGAQVELLRTVEADPGVGVAEVARRLHLAPNTISTLVRGAVDDGMLHRDPDPADRRAARLTLTRDAVERLTARRRARAALVDAALTRLPGPDRDRLAHALPALHGLLAEIEREPVPAGEPEPAVPAVEPEPVAAVAGQRS